MRPKSCRHYAAAMLIAAAILSPFAAHCDLELVPYNNPALKVDLGVGLWAWPLPMDWDGDGDLDLIVSCPDVPHNGVYFFENPGGDRKLPIFKPGVRIGDALANVQFCEVDGKPRVLTPGTEWLDFLGKGFEKNRKLDIPRPNSGPGNTRARQWRYVDFDGNAALDVVIGHGWWGDYGWDNAYDAAGNWTQGPLHGYVYLVRNEGTTEEPAYAAAKKLEAGGAPVDVFGMPSPNFADFDGDGDLDLICGEFLDGFTWFQNTGTRTAPVYAAGRRLAHNGVDLAMNLQMITPTAVDWDRDGDIDLICGDEDGRVALVENTGRQVDGMPNFLPPVYFQQEAEYLKFGALVTPVSIDWDADGDEDIVAGDSAGHIAVFENLGMVAGKPTPKWAAPKLLEAAGRPLRIQAGPNGSIQGPAEAKWGYTTLSVADWDHDGLLDLVVNSIWGKVVWFRNTGTKTLPILAATAPIEVAWPGTPPKPAWNWWNPTGNELVTQWRTTPIVVDWNRDGLNDLLSLDHEGYLAFFERQRVDGNLILLPGKRIFRDGTSDGSLLRLSSGTAGKSGRRKICLVDWDGDGRRDLLINARNAEFLRNLGDVEGQTVFRNEGPLSGMRLAGHTTSPTTVDWDRNGKPDLLLGAEDGFLYYLPNQRAAEQSLLQQPGMDVYGRMVEMAALANGEKAYSNRSYTWQNVPTELKGWQFTRTRGGDAASIRVAARQNMVLHLATADNQAGLDLTGWTKTELSFSYTDKGQTRMAVYRRTVKAGDSTLIPQGNWSGGILLIPPK